MFLGTALWMSFWSRRHLSSDLYRSIDDTDFFKELVELRHLELDSAVATAMY